MSNLSIKVLQSFIEDYKHLGVLLDKKFDELKEYNRKKRTSNVHNI